MINSIDAAPFLAAIEAAPHDSAPKLIYADWLDEHGEDPRLTAFIRYQEYFRHEPIFDGVSLALLEERAILRERLSDEIFRRMSDGTLSEDEGLSLLRKWML